LPSPRRSVHSLGGDRRSRPADLDSTLPPRSISSRRCRLPRVTRGAGCAPRAVRSPLRPLPAATGQRAAGGPGLDSRDQTRRLPDPRAPARVRRSALLPQRPQLRALYHLHGRVACRRCHDLWFASQRASSYGRKALASTGSVQGFLAELIQMANPNQERQPAGS
jgi:hypothetical protein